MSILRPNKRLTKKSVIKITRAKINRYKNKLYHNDFVCIIQYTLIIFLMSPLNKYESFQLTQISRFSSNTESNAS